jgi:3-oxoacyl-[acyl-carrier protein] reductase
MSSSGRDDILAHASEAADLDIPDLTVGQLFTLQHTFDSDAVDNYARLVGDFSPLHVHDGYAQETDFGGRVVHGMLLASLFSTLVGMKIPGRRALYIGQDIKFRHPVLVGEPVVATAKVASINAGLGVIEIVTTIHKDDKRVAVSGVGKVRVRSRSVAPSAETSPGPLRETVGRPVALVTGSSRGIGAAIAKRLAADGFVVAVNYKSDYTAAQNVVAAIAGCGGSAIPVQGDVCNAEDVASMIGAVSEQFGRLDLLVNNAASHYERKPAMDLTCGDVDEQFNTSVRGPLLLCQAAYLHLREREGNIVNIASQVVEGQPPAQVLHYALGKFGLLGLTRCLAAEWSKDGIRVNAVAPGLVETDLTSHFNERVFKLEASRTPLKRIATPEDVASAVSFLGGKSASFLTGLLLPVTGGQVMK